MTLSEFIGWPRIHPHDVFAHASGLSDAYYLRRWNRRLPRNFVAKINRFPNRRNKGKRDKEDRLLHRAPLHFIIDSAMVPSLLASLHCAERSEEMPAYWRMMLPVPVMPEPRPQIHSRYQQVNRT